MTTTTPTTKSFLRSLTHNMLAIKNSCWRSILKYFRFGKKNQSPFLNEKALKVIKFDKTFTRNSWILVIKFLFVKAKVELYMLKHRKVNKKVIPHVQTLTSNFILSLIHRSRWHSCLVSIQCVTTKVWWTRPLRASIIVLNPVDYPKTLSKAISDNDWCTMYLGLWPPSFPNNWSPINPNHNIPRLGLT